MFCPFYFLAQWAGYAGYTGFLIFGFVLFMLLSSLRIPPGADFWNKAVSALLQTDLFATFTKHHQCIDLSSLQMIVPTYLQAQQLKTALGKNLGGTFLLPRIHTLSVWTEKSLPYEDENLPSATMSARLLRLYAELRQHQWLQKLFSAARTTDLLSLAHTLLVLCDEITVALLPFAKAKPELLESHWKSALAHLGVNAQALLSEETQLVWSIWKSQIDQADGRVQNFNDKLILAEQAHTALIWISPVEPDPCEQIFLQTWSQKQPVQIVTLDWRAPALSALYAVSWPEILTLEETASTVLSVLDTSVTAPAGLSMYAAASLEAEAIHGAQTVLQWIAAGKNRIAMVTQDRLVARRVRALLARAQIYAVDETGWKLATTRAAACVMAWFELVSRDAQLFYLLDFLKSPFLYTDKVDIQTAALTIETVLQRADKAEGWVAICASLTAFPAEQSLVSDLAQYAGWFNGLQTIQKWSVLTRQILQDLGISQAFQKDEAGLEILSLLEEIEREHLAERALFSLAEWCFFIAHQMETATFIPADQDTRVVMLPLNGARLRTFEAVLMLGVDVENLPSYPQDFLFFANTVRRELGLSTHESLKRQQLRDFAELLQANQEIVLCWQAYKNGQPVAVSPWVERLQLTLARLSSAPLPVHQIALPVEKMMAVVPEKPRPAAPGLLPKKISASDYNTLVACPYQFFATRMLRLFKYQDVSDASSVKREYGDWLHQILFQYHQTVEAQATPVSERTTLMATISDTLFAQALKDNPSLLGLQARWKKLLPLYLNWANQRESQGWRFSAGESWQEQLLSWPGGETILHGCIDRIDHMKAAGINDDKNTDAAFEEAIYAILDYKTTNAVLLREKIKTREDHQLAFYGLLMIEKNRLEKNRVDQASYIVIEQEKGKDRIINIEVPDYAKWQQALEIQMANNMCAIANAAALPADGIEEICRYCNVRGLCRKGSWREVP